MENDDDSKLSELLREWRVPDAPRPLDERVLGPHKPWWRFLLTGSIRIPVPVGVALAVLLFWMAGALLRPRPAAESASPSLDLVQFRPVHDLNVRVIRGHESN